VFVEFGVKGFNDWLALFAHNSDRNSSVVSSMFSHNHH
jgi:hypothetical protein